MSAASVAYLKRALFWLVTTTAMYPLMNGAQIFETALIVPAWTAAPPRGMLQGPYRVDFKAFWIAFHSVHELTFVAALVVCWRLTRVRRWLLVLLVLHILVRVWTIAYSRRRSSRFRACPCPPRSIPLLAQKAAQWRHLKHRPRPDLPGSEPREDLAHPAGAPNARRGGVHDPRSR